MTSQTAKKARDFYDAFYFSNPEATLNDAIVAAKGADIPPILDLAKESRRKMRRFLSTVTEGTGMSVDSKKQEAKPWFDASTQLKSKPRTAQSFGATSVEYKPVITPVITPVAAPKPVMPSAPAPEPVQPAPTPEPQHANTPISAKASIIDEKVRMVRELIAQKPDIHPQEIIGKVRERFGEGMKYEFIYDECRAARDRFGLPQIPKRFALEGRQLGAKEGDEAIKALIKEMDILVRESGFSFEELIVSFGEGKSTQWTCSVKTTFSGSLE